MTLDKQVYFLVPQGLHLGALVPTKWDNATCLANIAGPL